MTALTNVLRAIPAVLLLACAPGPIVWGDAEEEKGSSLAGTNFDGGMGRDSSTPRPPVSADQCALTVRVWRADARRASAAWWRLRPDSSADIVASSTSDGRTWTPPVPLDTADAAKVGCHRVPPGVFVDGDNLHVVYAMRAREGPGVFLSHSMDRGRTFHSPVAVVYGEKLGLASVAAAGNFVVVAYEDPNTTPTRISIALSTTMAHLFEYREVISPEDAAASDPRVSVDGRRVLVMWHRAADSVNVIRRAGAVR